MPGMPSTCSQCDSEATASLKQEPLCEDHAQERLAELQEKADELATEVHNLKDRYENLCDKYDVNSYGEIEHQLTVEGRDDITEDDVEKVNTAEAKFAAKRDELRGVEASIDNLKQDL